MCALTQCPPPPPPPPPPRLFHSFLSSPRYVPSSLSFSRFVRYITPSISTLTQPSSYLSHTFLFSPPSLPLLINCFLYHLSPLHSPPFTHPSHLSPIFVLSFFAYSQCHAYIHIRATINWISGHSWFCLTVNTINIALCGNVWCVPLEMLPLIHRQRPLSSSWINFNALQWRHNGRDTVSNQQPHHCLLNLLFGRRSKKTSKLRVTGLCVGNSPVTGEFPTQMASNAEGLRHQYLAA